MKILIVTACSPYCSAVPFVLTELCEIVRQGHNITIIPAVCKEDPYHHEARELEKFALRKPVFSLQMIGATIAELFQHPIRLFRALGFVFKSRSLKILVKNTAAFCKGIWVGRHARKNEYEHIHAYWATVSASIAAIAHIISGINWSLTSYRWDISENNLLLAKSRTATFFRVADSRGAVEMTTYMSDNKSARVLYSGVNMPASLIKKKIGNRLSAVVPASFREKKGHTYLFQALEKLKSKSDLPIVYLAGDGDLRDQLEQEVTERGISRNVKFLGILDHKDLLNGHETGRWDICIMPSIESEADGKEGIPISLIEALSRGVPTISTPTGGIEELLGGGAGYLVSEKDPDALAEAIQDVSNNRGKLKELRANGFNRVQKQYEVSEVIRTLIDWMKAPI